MVLNPSAVPRQFDLCRTRGAAAQFAPYLLVLQTNLLDALDTVVVAPVRVEAEVGRIMGRLHVRLEHAGQPHVLTVEELVSLPRAVLGSIVDNMAGYRGEIIAALDFLFTGI